MLTGLFGNVLYPHDVPCCRCGCILFDFIVSDSVANSETVVCGYSESHYTVCCCEVLQICDGPMRKKYDYGIQCGNLN